MTRKFLLLFLCLFSLSLSVSLAQQNDSYKGLKFDAQPKHQSEIGIHLGHFMVVGDVLPRPGWGAGLHFRRAFDYAFSWRIDAMYGQAFGLEPRNSGGSTRSHAAANRVLNGSLNNGLDYTAAPWYANYKTKYMSLTAEGIWSLNSFNFKKQIRKVNWYVLAGVGLNSYKAYYDAKDGSDRQYDFTGLPTDTETSRDARKDAKKILKDRLDGKYETRAETATGRRGEGGDEAQEFQLNVHANVGVGMSYKINEKFNISLEHKVTVLFGNESDLLDGYRWRTTEDLSQYRDMINYTSIRLNFNLGKRENRSEPLWWVSPLGLIAEDLAEVKARPIFDKTDKDKDGVIDILDDELDTPAGYPVDTKGVKLDSDGDNVPDGGDKEPYSPPGYDVDNDGIAQVPDPGYLNEDDVNRVVDTKLAAFKSTLPLPETDWFLPIINFDLNKYGIRRSEFGKLHQVASVMKRYPDMRVAVVGNTDRTAGDCYNDVLSFNRAEATINYLVNKYGVSRDRLVLNWKGEADPLIDTKSQTMWNRRVEFQVVTNETEQSRPDCGVKKAGSGSGTGYSGNKEAGY